MKRGLLDKPTPLGLCRWLLIVVCLGGGLQAAAEQPSAPLEVAIAELPPSVMNVEGTWTGFEVDLWRRVAGALDVSFTLKPMPFEDLLNAVAAGEVDLALAGITMTAAREEHVDFSHPVLDAGLRILVRDETKLSIGSVIDSLLKEQVLEGLLYLVAFLVVCGHMVWWAERGQDSINDKYVPGIFEAFWWALVTMTTVGYGDIAPKKWLGRFAAVLVMFSGIAFFGWFVAVLSSSMSFERLTAGIESADDLRGRTVATKVGTTSAEVTERLGGRLVAVRTIDEAYQLLRDGSVDAVIFDEPSILYALHKGAADGLALTGSRFFVQHYGVALPQDSPWREPINRTLLQLRQDGTYTALRAKYFDALTTP